VDRGAGRALAQPGRSGQPGAPPRAGTVQQRARQW
jgi:hypothetical protein